MAYAYLSPTIPTPSCYNLAPLFFNFPLPELVLIIVSPHIMPSFT